MTEPFQSAFGLIQSMVSLKNGLELILTFLILLQLLYLTLKVQRSPLFWAHYTFLTILLFHFIILNAHHYFGVLILEPFLFYPCYAFSLLLSADLLNPNPDKTKRLQTIKLNLAQFGIGLTLFFLVPLHYHLNSLHLVIVLLYILQKSRKSTFQQLKNWLIRTSGFMMILVGLFPITMFLTTTENYLIFKIPYAIVFVIFLIQNFYSFLGKLRFFMMKEAHEDLQPEPLLNKLIDVLEGQKIYKKQALTLNELSKEINEPVYKISKTLNRHYGKSFPELINHLRISDIKARLVHEDGKTMKIETLAYEVGFNTPSSFYVAFKKELGITPGEFRNNISREDANDRLTWGR